MFTSVYTSIRKCARIQYIYVCVCVCVCVLYVDVLLWAVFVYLRVEWGESVCAQSERCHRELLTPLIQHAGERSSLHATRPPELTLLSARLKQYERRNATRMQASAFMHRCDWSDLIISLSDMSVPSKRASATFCSREDLIKDIRRLGGPHGYSSGSKSASLSIIQKCFVSAEKHPWFSDGVSIVRGFILITQLCSCHGTASDEDASSQ